MTQYDPATYPPVGHIAVTRSGSRIQVWPQEGEDQECFAGLLLATGAPNHATRIVHDLSTLWDRSRVIGIEVPTDSDRRLFLGHDWTAA